MDLFFYYSPVTVLLFADLELELVLRMMLIEQWWSTMQIGQTVYSSDLSSV